MQGLVTTRSVDNCPGDVSPESASVRCGIKEFPFEVSVEIFGVVDMTGYETIEKLEMKSSFHCDRKYRRPQGLYEVYTRYATNTYERLHTITGTSIYPQQCIQAPYDARKRAPRKKATAAEPHANRIRRRQHLRRR